MGGLQTCMWQRDVQDTSVLQPCSASAVDLLPTVAYPDKPATSFTTEFIHPSTNKVPCSINRVLWTPTGRRLITGSQSGEFTLWNGQSFNFEMILQAHDQAVQSMIWSHNENWMVTGDDGGCIKYWQTNMNNVKANKTAHKEAVCDLSFSSTDLKFCSCSDDTTIKLSISLQYLADDVTGNGRDVKSVDWHPQKSLLVSGAKDNLVKLWDAKMGRELCTLFMMLEHSRSRKLTMGIRRKSQGTCFLPTMRTSGSKKTWVSSKLRGNRHEGQQAEVANAHESSVWDLAWHPMGHIFCSGSNDHTTKFWCRNHPSETLHDNRHNNAHSQGNASESQAVGLSTPGAIAGGGPVCGEGAIPGVRMTLSLDPAGANRSVVQNAMPTSNPPILHGPYPPTTPCPTSVCQLQQPPLLPRPLPCLQPPPRPPPSAASPLDLPGCGMMMSTQTMHNPRPISPPATLGSHCIWRATYSNMRVLVVGAYGSKYNGHEAYGMAMGMSMNVPMGMNMGLPLHPHPPGPPHV
ncbi:unnamed protein product [Sphagnum troendelagicum]|uniref:Uncharacterized protein n=1 Tax=Sphagnum troendelagicum TaxID=128251 RepID=A0ABP0TW86_9BRYO